MKQGSGSEVVVPNGHVKVIYTDGGGTTAAVTDAFIDLNLNNLIIKNPATSSSPATLLLQTGDTDVAVNDVLGKLQFQAPDEGTGTDAILVAAEVAAVSEGDFSSSSNATKLSFRTGASEAATTAATEKMAISSVGNVTIKNTATGDDTPVTLLLRTGETDIAASDVLGKIQFQAPDEGTGGDAQMIAAEVAAVSEGDFSSTSNATKLSFKTGASEAATEKMSLSSGGNLTVSGTYNGGGLMTTGGNIVIPDSGYIGSASDTDAVQINSAGNVYLTQGFRIEAGDTSLNSFYERGVIYMGRNQAGDNYTDMDGKGIIIYDDQGTAGTTFIRMLVANGTTAGDPVWQNKLSGTIKSEIEVSGDFLSATNSYASTSDARLKEHITDSGSQWNDIKAMRVRKYSFKEEKVDAPNMIGVIAQELESAGMGKLVKTHLESNPADDGGDEVPVLDSSGNQKSFKSVKYSVIHMKALKALQEAMERIEALEAKVASLGG
jgi:hypothetical protein